MNHLEPKMRKYIEGQLRRLFRYTAQYKNVKKRAHIDGEIYRCEGCKQLINKNGKDKRVAIEVEGEAEVATPSKMYVDHIEPFVPLKGWDNNTAWARQCIERMYLPEDELQYLCHQCHKEKTNEENRVRRIYRGKRKKK